MKKKRTFSLACHVLSALFVHRSMFACEVQSDRIIRCVLTTDGLFPWSDINEVRESECLIENHREISTQPNKIKKLLVRSSLEWNWQIEICYRHDLFASVPARQGDREHAAAILALHIFHRNCIWWYVSEYWLLRMFQRLRTIQFLVSVTYRVRVRVCVYAWPIISLLSTPSILNHPP